MSDFNYDVIPETVKEAVDKWESEIPLFSVEMGGFGPGYEQVIQRLAFEVMREMEGKELPENDVDKQFDEIMHNFLKKDDLGGPTGAQVGAAKNLAFNCLKKGYRKALSEVPSDQLIQVCKKRV